MNLRKLFLLGLIGFYSSMPIQIQASYGSRANSLQSFVDKYESEIIIGYLTVWVCTGLLYYYTLNQGVILTPKQLERVAYHEIGHTLVALHNEAILGNLFDKVTVVPGWAGSLGLTTTVLSEESRNLLTQDQYLAYIRFALGGYVAEELMYGQISSTVSGDLAQVSFLARQMVTLYGMHASTGKIFYQSNQMYSQETLQKIDAAVQQIVEEQYEWVKAFLEEKKESLKLLGNELLKEKTLTSKQVKELLGIGCSSQDEPLIA